MPLKKEPNGAINLGRVAVYMRCSTSDQSTDLQRKEITEYLSHRPHTDITFYDDAAHSGVSKTRPAMSELMEDARKKRIHTIVVYKLDRWFRSLRETIVTLQELNDLDVAFIAINNSLDATTSEGRLILHVIAAFAEFERDLIIDRVKAGLKVARAKGKTFGRRKTKFDEEQAKALRAGGMSWGHIGKTLGVAPSVIYARLNPKTDPKTP